MTPIADDISMIPVSVATLIPDTLPGVALYMHTKGSAAPTLYRGAEYPIEQQDLDALKERKVSKLYVSSDAHSEYQKYLRENLDQILQAESAPVESRVGCLNEVMRDVLADAFRPGQLDERVGQLSALGEKTVDMICRDDVVLSGLRSVLKHDYHTFTHSANVAMYCVMLAKAMGMEDRVRLSAIATGALLHDAGKLDVPNAILTKPGKLDDQELALMRKHPTWGFRTLCRRADLSFGQLMMVYQHHENADASGYPVGCVANEIHEWGQICHVADVFEALTSNRPYRAAMSFEDAYAYMEGKARTQFNSETLACWKQIIFAR